MPKARRWVRCGCFITIPRRAWAITMWASSSGLPLRRPSPCNIGRRRTALRCTDGVGVELRQPALQVARVAATFEKAGHDGEQADQESERETECHHDGKGCLQLP